MFTETCLLAFTLSIDAFAASFAYGSGKIKIPALSVLIINIICSSMLLISTAAGRYLRAYLTPEISKKISFVILLTIGVVKLLDNLTKALIRKHRGINKDIRFSLLNLSFVLNIYADPEAADADESKSISAREAVSLAAALSFDGIAAGFGAAISGVRSSSLLVFSLTFNTAAILFGVYLGETMSSKIKFNMSWISGVILMIMAFMKII